MLSQKRKEGRKEEGGKEEEYYILRTVSMNCTEFAKKKFFFK